MVRTATAWILPLLGLLAVGPLVAQSLGRLRTDAGLPFATPLISASPVIGLAAAGLVLGVAVAFGLAAARAVDLRSAFNASGCVLLWGAWRTGPLEETLQSSDPTAAMLRLSIEGLLIGLVFWFGASAFEAYARPAHAPHASEPSNARPAGLKAVIRATLMTRSGWAAVAGSVLAGGAVAWFFAAEPLKNQGVFAALLAGIAAGAAGRIAGQAAGDDPPVSATWFGIATLACIGPASSLLVHGDALETVARLGQIRGLAVVMPFDWVAGACFGVPIGRAWAHASQSAEPDGSARRSSGGADKPRPARRAARPKPRRIAR